MRTESREQDGYTQMIEVYGCADCSGCEHKVKCLYKYNPKKIRTEGHFGDIKENESFRHFSYRSTEKVYKEFMLYAISGNINKYHRFLHQEIIKYEGKPEQKTA